MLTPSQMEAAQALVNAHGHGATRTMLAQNLDALTDPAVLELLAFQLTQRDAHTLEHRVIAARLARLEVAAEHGLVAAFAGYDAAAAAFLELLEAPDWDAAAEVAARRLPDLAPDAADVAYADLAMEATRDDELLSRVLGGWNLVQAIRRDGVDAAIGAQRMGYRGFVIDAETARKIVADREAGVEPDTGDARLDRRLAQDAEYERQVAAWDGRPAYVAAYDTADAATRIELARAALAEIDREALPLMWMLVARDLAVDLRDAADGDAPDLREPIRLWREVLDILDPQTDPDDYGKTQLRLGEALLVDAAGDPVANTEEAVAAFEAALSRYRPRVEPAEWARSASNLAEALRRRNNADRAADLDRAAELAAEAVRVAAGQDDPRLLAGARLTLGTVLLDRLSGDPSANRRAAEEVLVAVLEMADAGSDTQARVRVNLGWLAWQEATVQPSRYRELFGYAEAQFRAALAATEEDGPARLRALAHQGLGLVVSDRIGAGGAEYDVAAFHLGAALELLEAAGAAPSELGVVRHNLGVVEGERPGRDAAANLAAALPHFDAALAHFDRAADPADRRDTLRALGSRYFAAHRWEEAHERYREAAELSAELLSGIVSEPGQRTETRSGRSVFSRDAYCLVRLDRPGEALARLDAGMARMLSLSLRVMAGAESKGGPAWAAAEIRRLRAEARAPGVAADPLRAGRLGRRLRDAYRVLGSAADRGVPDLGELLKAIPPGGAVVAPVVTTAGAVAIVVPAGADEVTARHVVELPDLDVAALGRIVAGEGGAGGWANAQLAFGRGDADGDDLMAALAETMTSLAGAFTHPVRAGLGDLGVGGPVVLLPQGMLSLLPIHAAGAGASLVEHHDVWFAPSLAVLAACRARLAGEQRAGAALLAVADPTGDLHLAGPEAAAIAALFEEHRGSDTLVLPGPAATDPAVTSGLVTSGLAGRNYVHFACHAAFDWSDPDASGLVLAGGDRLSLADILSPDADFRSARMVVLSACETGLTEFREMPDEYLGLAGALLEGGAPCVVSSLWTVEDVPTKLLMAEFYRRHLAGASVAHALRRAQQWLRDGTARSLGVAAEYRLAHARSGDPAHGAAATFFEANPEDVPYSDPYFWAAFTAAGAAG